MKTNVNPYQPPHRKAPPPTRAAYPLCDGLVLRAPIVQAALGPCDGPDLAAAVSRAGALGTVTIRTPKPAAFTALLRRIRYRTGRPVMLAFNAEWEPESLLSTAFDYGFLQFGLYWWNGARLSRRIHAAGGKVLWQVGTLEQAQEAIDCGADVLIAQGTEAGGQVRSPNSIREFVPALAALCGDKQVPIVAGGGLATRSDVAEMLELGASAALLGTRFLLSEESAAPRSDKRRLLFTSTEDLTLDSNLAGDWPCAPRRRLCLSSGADRPSLFAGCGIGRVRSIRTAAEIVRALIPQP